MFLVELLFQFINMIFSWFAIGNFFLVFQILTTSLSGKESLSDALSKHSQWLSSGFIFGTLRTCFVVALGNKLEVSPRFYRATAWIFGRIMLLVLLSRKELNSLTVVKVSHICIDSDPLQVREDTIGRCEVYILGSIFQLGLLHFHRIALVNLRALDIHLSGVHRCVAHNYLGKKPLFFIPSPLIPH
jgi:hypothetical protein